MKKAPVNGLLDQVLAHSWLATSSAADPVCVLTGPSLEDGMEK